MSNIAEELKTKFGGKGQSIAEVVKTMEGSGSGGSGVEMTYVTFTKDNSSNWVCDTSKDDIWAALQAGKQVVGKLTHDVYGTPYIRGFVNLCYDGGAVFFLCGAVFWSISPYASDKYTYTSRSLGS